MRWAWLSRTWGALQHRETMQYQSIIGIDPGQKGGICIRPMFGKKVPQLWPMPRRDEGVDWREVAEILSGVPGKVFIEKCGAMPKQGVSSTFKFGVNYGGLLGVCGALKLPVTLVTPQSWKKVVLEEYEEKDKDAAIDYFCKLWPKDMLIPDKCRTPQDGLADAFCISEFGWRARE